MKKSILLFASCFSLSLMAQSTLQLGSDSSMYPEAKLFESKKEPILEPKLPGKLIVHQDKDLDILIDGYREQKEVEGYKIQLFSGRSRMEAVKVKSSFHSKYGESESAEILYQQPNFKIRIGNYRDRLSATKALQVYKVDFPSSFLVKDAIKINQED